MGGLAIRTGCLLVVLMTAPAGQTPEVAEPSEEIMWRKIDLAHDVLDALALEDYEALAAYGEDLRSLSFAGEVFISGGERYRTLSGAFRAAAEELIDSARAHDLNGAALANVELTLSCIRCHRQLGALPR